MKDSVLLQEAYKEACSFMTDAIRLGVDSKQKDQFRAAAVTLGAYTRLRAVENNETSISLAVARTMANNNDELKDMVRKSLPEFVK